MFLILDKSKTSFISFSYVLNIYTSEKKYLNNYHYKSPSGYELLQLLGAQHTPTLAGLGKCLHQAFDIRNSDNTSLCM
jgi:hypothetical protein